jgi:NADPH:quinone reductase-like Zn-dependent oxidoreductase
MKPDSADLATLLQLVATGAIRPNIVARYPLQDAAEALIRLERGHAPGKLIISVQQGETI